MRKQLVIGGKYNWINQPERLVYTGIFYGGGLWHQFAKVESPDVVWCEVAQSELHLIEETKQNPVILVGEPFNIKTLPDDVFSISRPRPGSVRKLVPKLTPEQLAWNKAVDVKRAKQ